MQYLLFKTQNLCTVSNTNKSFQEKFVLTNYAIFTIKNVYAVYVVSTLQIIGITNMVWFIRQILHIYMNPSQRLQFPKTIWIWRLANSIVRMKGVVGFCWSELPLKRSFYWKYAEPTQDRWTEFFFSKTENKLNGSC